MNNILKLVASLLLQSTISYAQQPGLDLLGLAKHDPYIVAEEIPSGIAIGFLMGTFGDVLPNLRVLLDTGRVTTIRAHIVDGTCIRNKNCESGAPGYDDRKVFTNRVDRLRKFMLGYPSVSVFISPYLEHDERRERKVYEWYADLKRIYPNSIPVCSALTGFCPRSALREKHHCGVTGAITSPDGESGFDCNNFILSQGASSIFFSWIPQNNGRVSGEDVFITPKARVNFSQRSDIIQQLITLRPATNYNPVPGCPVIAAPSLFKTNAEYFGRTDSRGNKALFITTHRTSRFTLHRLDGTKIGSLGYYGAYSGGGFRYYIGGRYGSGQAPTQLYRDLGGEWGLLKDGKYCRVFNAIRRLGYYR